MRRGISERDQIHACQWVVEEREEVGIRFRALDDAGGAMARLVHSLGTFAPPSIRWQHFSRTIVDMHSIVNIRYYIWGTICLAVSSGLAYGKEIVMC